MMDSRMEQSGVSNQGIEFTPEVEREWEELRKTIQHEYRIERREALFKGLSLAGGFICVAWVLYSGIGFILQ